MAEFTVGGLDDLMLDLEQIAELPDSVLDQILNEQADIVVRNQKRVAQQYGVEDTGQLISSITKSKMKTTKDGASVSIYFKGRRVRNGEMTKNDAIAFFNEYGKRGQPARPFVRDANAESEPAAERAAFAVYDDFLKSKNL